MPLLALSSGPARRLIAASIVALAGCAPKGEPRAPNRLGLALQQDFGIVVGEDVCSKQAQLADDFACFRSNGTQYHGSPAPSARDEAGIGPATTRVLIGYDRVLFRNWALGARGGLVVRGGGPKPDGAAAPAFLPFHGELRAAYWFGADPFARSGWRFGLLLGGGIAQVDTGFSLLIQEDLSRPRPAAQPNNPFRQTLDVYKKTGTGFVGGGASVAWAPSRASAFFLNVKLMQLFPSDGAAIAPEIGYERGF